MFVCIVFLLEFNPHLISRHVSKLEFSSDLLGTHMCGVLSSKIRSVSLVKTRTCTYSLITCIVYNTIDW